MPSNLSKIIVEDLFLQKTFHTRLEILNKILTNVLTALYQPFWFAVILSILFMFFYLYAKEHGWKESIRIWISKFKASSYFRRSFLLVFYTTMILFRTLLNRNMWMNPLSNVMGGWWLWEDGELTTEPIENLMLMVPFTVLLLWAAKDKLLLGKGTKENRQIGESGGTVKINHSPVAISENYVHFLRVY